VRWALKEGLPSPLFGPAMKMGQAGARPAARGLKAKVPAAQDAGAWPHAQPCAQGADAGRLRAAGHDAQHQRRHRPRARRAGIQTVVAGKAGCCGAVKFHLNDQDGGLADMRANIDAWWPLIEGRRGRSHRHERLGLRRHGEGLRPPAARRPAYAAKARASAS
jgi:glycolate oxidase iron-sulfur subunit